MNSDNSKWFDSSDPDWDLGQELRDVSSPQHLQRRLLDIPATVNFEPNKHFEADGSIGSDGAIGPEVDFETDVAEGRKFKSSNKNEIANLDEAISIRSREKMFGWIAVAALILVSVSMLFVFGKSMLPSLKGSGEQIADASGTSHSEKNRMDEANGRIPADEARRAEAMEVARLQKELREIETSLSRYQQQLAQIEYRESVAKLNALRESSAKYRAGQRSSDWDQHVSTPAILYQTAELSENLLVQVGADKANGAAREQFKLIVEKYGDTHWAKLASEKLD